MRKIAIINQKGGVGKTTTTANLGAALAIKQLRVCLIDLDPQAHLTMHLGVDGSQLANSSYELLTRGIGFEDALVAVRPNLWLVPSQIDLAAAEVELVGVVGRELILRDALAESKFQFDVLLVDCPPSLGLLTLNGLAAVEEVVIPMLPHFLALQGVGKLLETVELVHKRINPRLKVTGVVMCMFESRTQLGSEVLADLEHFFDSHRQQASCWSQARVFRTRIRRNIKLAECPSHGKVIFEYAPTCNGAIDYEALAVELLGEGLCERLAPSFFETTTRVDESLAKPAESVERAVADATLERTLQPAGSADTDEKPLEMERITRCVRDVVSPSVPSVGSSELSGIATDRSLAASQPPHRAVDADSLNDGDRLDEHANPA